MKKCIGIVGAKLEFEEILTSMEPKEYGEIYAMWIEIANAVTSKIKVVESLMALLKRHKKFALI